MLPLTDPRWKTYSGGYGIPYDASVPLHQLFTNGGSEALWKELWNELHHQGDLGEASYAAVPHLLEFARAQERLDWNVFALVAVIELERPHNLDVPQELSESYFSSISGIPSLIANHADTSWDDLLMRSVASCLALARGQREFSRVYLELSLQSGLDWLRDEIGYEHNI